MDCDPAALMAASKCYCGIPRSMWPRINIDLLCEIENAAPAGCQNDVVDDWVVRVGVNGGTAPSQDMKDALCQFMNRMDAFDLTSKMKSVCCFVPGEASPATAAGDLIRAITPLIDTYGNDPWTNVGPFLPGDLTIDGLIGNASSKALDTGVAPDPVLSMTSAGLTIYSMTAVDQDYNDLAVGTTAPLRLLTIQANQGTASPNSESLCCCYDFANRAHAVNNLWRGFLSGNRTAANLLSLYKANGSTAFTTVDTDVNATTGLRSTEPIACFARKAGGVYLGYSARRLSFAAIHDGLGATDCENFYNFVQALRTALGGGHV